MNNPDSENSVCCDSCNLWWHIACVGSTDIESEDQWLCNSCILDMVTPDTVQDQDYV